MSEYSPDAWVILKLTNDDVIHYRVFGGWYGGYLNGDSWKMNSGIVETIEHENYYDFVGKSGSVYHCRKDEERMSGYMSNIFSHFAEQQTDTYKIEVIDFTELPR